MKDNETLQGQPQGPLDSDSFGGLVPSRQAGRSLVLMQVRKTLVAVDADQVERVAVPGPITLLPRSPAHIEGLMLAGSSAIPVLDLGALLDLPQDEDPDEDRAERMVVVEAGQLTAAIRCHTVRILRDLPHDRLGPITIHRGEALLHHAEREVELDDRIAVILNLRSVLEAARVQRQ